MKHSLLGPLLDRLAGARNQSGKTVTHKQDVALILPLANANEVRRGIRSVNAEVPEPSDKAADAVSLAQPQIQLCETEKIPRQMRLRQTSRLAAN
jgi:hypothetical protein